MQETTDTIVQLKQLYQDMYKLTFPECGCTCRVPHSCCDPGYCEMTAEWAKSEYGITLTPVQEEGLIFMAQTGCVVEPYLRPMCALHTCAINSFGYKPGDQEWTNQYFELRSKIESAEAERMELV